MYVKTTTSSDKVSMYVDTTTSSHKVSMCVKTTTIKNRTGIKCTIKGCLIHKLTEAAYIAGWVGCFIAVVKIIR